MLRELMWEIFLSTGDIRAYLLYRHCGGDAADSAGLGRE
ncbi:YqzL family protein [Anaeroselena agilis]|uniref:YqzL family protein n=1 Tax=Anaeroselena agilis TaxID=3063788 RepID=A0ABU3P047_9FIRM|nr:YqzL family protein [Selenomonadales bacterium 4137-cl]